MIVCSWLMVPKYKSTASIHVPWCETILKGTINPAAWTNSGQPVLTNMAMGKSTAQTDDLEERGRMTFRGGRCPLLWGHDFPQNCSLGWSNSCLEKCQGLAGHSGINPKLHSLTTSHGFSLVVDQPFADPRGFCGCLLGRHMVHMVHIHCWSYQRATSREPDG